MRALKYIIERHEEYLSAQNGQLSMMNKGLSTADREAADVALANLIALQSKISHLQKNSVSKLMDDSFVKLSSRELSKMNSIDFVQMFKHLT